MSLCDMHKITLHLFQPTGEHFPTGEYDNCISNLHIYIDTHLSVVYLELSSRELLPFIFPGNTRKKKSPGREEELIMFFNTTKFIIDGIVLFPIAVFFFSLAFMLPSIICTSRFHCDVCTSPHSI